MVIFRVIMIFLPCLALLTQSDAPLGGFVISLSHFILLAPCCAGIQHGRHLGIGRHIGRRAYEALHHRSNIAGALLARCLPAQSATDGHFES